MKFKFKQEDPDLLYNPSPNTFSYFQICSLKNPLTEKYTIRKLTYNEFNMLIKEQKREYTKKKLDLFISKCKVHKYRIFPTSDISDVNYPRPDEILNANSMLLN